MMRSRWRRAGIGVRLLAAQALVLLVAAAAVWVVAAIVGPPLFREHLHRAGVPADSLEELHAEEAYRYATALSIGGAVAVSALAALAVSGYAGRRLQRSVAEVASAATAVADGRYEIRVAPQELGEEFDSLARAFNQMATRLESVEATRRRLFGDLAHEIRTPVSVLDAYIEALEDGVRMLTPETAEVLRDQTRRLVRFSEDVAALAQAEENTANVSFCRVAVAALLERCAAAVAERFDDKGVALTVAVGGDVPPVWADPQRLAQVLANLLDNALRHTPGGGAVQLSADRVGRQVIVRVADDGEGVAPQHLPHLFERFYRADPSRNRVGGGAGIGLAIAKALTEAHGGDISAASAGPGQGTTITVTLPVSESV
ncbi:MULTISPECIES: sensor histidine kinase [Mycobacteriaceae]|uniref:ATP-binding protein n=2 Tax=Mycobacteriaceae TaxID=1762 RepID=A0ACC6MFX7_MYCPF|nr:MULTISPECIES: ATP-binding protein [Mycobacteriaceae]MDZ5085879.1 ATP-binding protein [Mycolicibacterium parafortuitum]